MLQVTRSQLNNTIHILYPHGALGHTMLELFNYCTIEGGQDKLQLRYSEKGEQHHLTSQLAKKIHPHGKTLTPLEYEIYPNIVVSTATTFFGKLLVELMGYIKPAWGNPPTLDNPKYTNFISSMSLGEKYEAIAVGFLDNLKNPESWYHNSYPQFDIEWYWRSTDRIEEFLLLQGLTPLRSRILEFAKTVQTVNKVYYNRIEYYFDLQHKIITGVEKNLELEFYEIIIIYALLLSYYQKNHTECKIFTTHPTTTLDFLNLFN